MKSSKIVAFLVAGLVLTTTSLSYAGGWVLGVHGGATIPTGDFADENLANAKTGWQFGAAVDYRLNEMWGLGIDGSMLQNKNDTEDADAEVTFKTLQFGAHAMWMFPMTGTFKPYALVGAGMYNLKVDTDLADNDSKSKFGYKVGLGGDYMFSPTMGLGLQANYNIIPVDAEDFGTDEDLSLQYVGIQAGLKFAMPTPGH